MIQDQVGSSVVVHVHHPEARNTARGHVLPERLVFKLQTAVDAFGDQCAFRGDLNGVDTTVTVEVSIQHNRAGQAAHRGGREGFLKQEVWAVVKQRRPRCAVIKQQQAAHNTGIADRGHHRDGVITDAQLRFAAGNRGNSHPQVVPGKTHHLIGLRKIESPAGIGEKRHRPAVAILNQTHHVAESVTVNIHQQKVAQHFHRCLPVGLRCKAAAGIHVEDIDLPLNIIADVQINQVVAVGAAQRRHHCGRHPVTDIQNRISLCAAGLQEVFKQ